MYTKNTLQSYLRHLLLIAASFALISSSTMANDTPDWYAVPQTSPITGELWSIVSSPTDLYVSGTITRVGDLVTDGVARFDLAADTWHSLGNGLTGDAGVLILDGNNLYVAGLFQLNDDPSVRNIARFDIATQTWHAVGGGVNNRVRAMTLHDGILYVGGDFTEASGLNTPRIARYDTQNDQWSGLGTGLLSGAVFILDAKDNFIYVGGQNLSASGVVTGGSTINALLRYDTDSESWSSLGIRFAGNVYALETWNEQLLIGGTFPAPVGSSAIQSSSPRLAVWNTDTAQLQAWPSTNIPSGAVRTFYRMDEQLYVGMQTSFVPGTTSMRIASLDLATATWSSMGSGVNSAVWTIGSFKNDVYVGGAFSLTGTNPFARLVRWGGPEAARPDPVDCTFTDTTAPELFVNATPVLVWPPNHKYRRFHIQDFILGVSDGCDTAISADDVVIAYATSDEAENGTGDGNTLNDIVISPDGRWVDVRAERSGNGNGRVYTVHLHVRDRAGNIATAPFYVHVRHNPRRPAIDSGPRYTVTGVEAPVPGAVPNTLSRSLAQNADFDSDVDHTELPDELTLRQNYPNPFNPSTTIAFQLPQSGHVRLQVFDVLGRRVALLTDSVWEAGNHEVRFDAGSLSSGVYLYRLESGTQIITRTMLLVK